MKRISRVLTISVAVLMIGGLFGLQPLYMSKAEAVAAPAKCDPNLYAACFYTEYDYKGSVYSIPKFSTVAGRNVTKVYGSLGWFDKQCASFITNRGFEVRVYPTLNATGIPVGIAANYASSPGPIMFPHLNPPAYKTIRSIMISTLS